MDVDDIVIFDLLGKRYIGDILEIDENEIITILKRNKSKDDLWNKCDESKRSNKSM